MNFNTLPPFTGNINSIMKPVTENNKCDIQTLYRFDTRLPEEIIKDCGFFPNKTQQEVYIKRAAHFAYVGTNGFVSMTSDKYCMSREYRDTADRSCFRLKDMPPMFCYAIDTTKIPGDIKEINAVGCIDLSEFICNKVPLDAILGYFECDKNNQPVSVFTKMPQKNQSQSNCRTA